MPIGLRQRDLSGNVLIEITTRLPRIIGRVNLTAGTNGSVVVPPSGTNPIVYWFNPSGAQPDYNTSPKFTDDGTTITWTYVSANPLYNRSGVLVYGRY